VLNILGFDRFIAYLAEKACAARKSLPIAPVPALRSLPLVLHRFCPDIALWLEIATCRAIPAP